MSEQKAQISAAYLYKEIKSIATEGLTLEEEQKRLKKLQDLDLKNIDVNYQDPKTGLTPLMWAVTIGDPALVRKLCEAGVNINLEDENGDTALTSSAALGNNPEKIIPILLEYNPSSLKSVQTALEHIRKDREFESTETRRALANQLTEKMLAGIEDLQKKLCAALADNDIKKIIYLFAQLGPVLQNLTKLQPEQLRQKASQNLNHLFEKLQPQEQRDVLRRIDSAKHACEESLQPRKGKSGPPYLTNLRDGLEQFDKLIQRGKLQSGISAEKNEITRPFIDVSFIDVFNSSIVTEMAALEEVEAAQTCIRQNLTQDEKDGSSTCPVSEQQRAVFTETSKILQDSTLTYSERKARSLAHLQSKKTRKILARSSPQLSRWKKLWFKIKTIFVNTEAQNLTKKVAKQMSPPKPSFWRRLFKKTPPSCSSKVKLQI